MRRLAAACLGMALALAASPPPAPSGAIRFRDVTKSAGVSFRYAADLRRAKTVATMGGGVAVGDVDGDSYPDLFFVGTAASGLFRCRGARTRTPAYRRSGPHHRMRAPAPGWCPSR